MWPAEECPGAGTADALRPVDRRSAHGHQTSVAAEALGIEEDQTGTLAAGKWADIILVQGNPLDDIRVLQDAQHASPA